MLYSKNFIFQHQKFLNKSVKQMQKLFGNFVENATLTSTIATDKSSDISSLGEIIVSKAKHNVPEYKKKSLLTNNFYILLLLL